MKTFAFATQSTDRIDRWNIECISPIGFERDTNSVARDSIFAVEHPSSATRIGFPNVTCKKTYSKTRAIRTRLITKHRGVIEGFFFKTAASIQDKGIFGFFAAF